MDYNKKYLKYLNKFFYLKNSIQTGGNTKLIINLVFPFLTNSNFPNITFDLSEFKTIKMIYEEIILTINRLCNDNNYIFIKLSDEINRLFINLEEPSENLIEKNYSKTHLFIPVLSVAKLTPKNYFFKLFVNTPIKHNLFDMCELKPVSNFGTYSSSLFSISYENISLSKYSIDFTTTFGLNYDLYNEINKNEIKKIISDRRHRERKMKGYPEDNLTIDIYTKKTLSPFPGQCRSVDVLFYIEKYLKVLAEIFELTLDEILNILSIPQIPNTIEMDIVILAYGNIDIDLHDSTMVTINNLTDIGKTKYLIWKEKIDLLTHI
jgi:hypothetical protein